MILELWLDLALIFLIFSGGIVLLLIGIAFFIDIIREW